MKDSFELNFDWRKYFIVSNNVIRQKENSEIEFKEAFHSPKGKDKKIHKWIASFANAHGGVIIYGVKDNGELVGLKNDKLRDFDNKDLTQELLNFFSPEIRFELFIKEVKGIDLGFLYIHQSLEKPIVAIKNANQNIKESDIYYRYPGESKRISYAELKNILEDRYRRLNEDWMKLISNIATIGVENIGLLDIQNGKLIGNKSNLLIQEDLLDKIKFINEGKFVEKEGAPALKLIGDVQSIDSRKVIIKTDLKAITQEQLYNVFFEQNIESKGTARECLREVLHENTVNFPVYFYLVNSELDKDQAVEFFTKEKGAKTEMLISRLKNERGNFDSFRIGEVNTDTEAGRKVKDLCDSIIKMKEITSDEINNMERAELSRLIQSITHLELEKINTDYILLLLKKIHHAIFNNDSFKTLRTSIRKAICHIDLIWHGQVFFK